MDLMAQLADDLRKFIDDYGEDITITSPDGVTLPFHGRTQDIFLTVDPGTGMPVSGRQCAVSVHNDALSEVGFSGIKAVASGRPWVVRWTNSTGVSVVLKVVEVDPDQTLGSIVLKLEGYKV
jgi:hypothetical protein